MSFASASQLAAIVSCADRAAADRGLGMGGAHDGRSHAPERDADVAHGGAAQVDRRREAQLRNRLRSPRADLPPAREPAAAAPRQPNRVDELVGSEIHLFVAEMESVVRYAPDAAHRYEIDVGVVHEQRRWSIGGRRRVRDVAADRAAILRRHAARLGRRAADERTLGLERLRAHHVGIGRERTEHDLVVRDLDAAQLGQAPETEILPRGQLPRLEQHHEIGPAGKRPPVARLAREGLERVGEVRGRPKIEPREERSHASGPGVVRHA